MDSKDIQIKELQDEITALKEELHKVKAHLNTQMSATRTKTKQKFELKLCIYE